jgi:hypothetical protein
MNKHGADTTILNARKCDSIGCAKDKKLKKLLEQCLVDTKSQAKKCLLERQTRVDLSHQHSSDILATGQVCQVESVARPVLEPKLSDLEDNRTARQTLKTEPSLPHDVRVAKLFEYLDSFHDRQSELSNLKSEQNEQENQFGRGLACGANSVLCVPSEYPELCSLLGAVEDSVWDIRFTREFKDQLFQLRGDVSLLLSFLQNLGRIAQGDDAPDLIYQFSMEKLRIYETPFSSLKKKLSMVWQIAPDYSPRIRGFTDTIRLWRICGDKNEVIIVCLFDCFYDLAIKLYFNVFLLLDSFFFMIFQMSCILMFPPG